MFLAIIVPPAKKDRFIGILVFASMALSGLVSVLPYLRELSSGFRVILLTLLLSCAAAFIRPVSSDAAANEGPARDAETDRCGAEVRTDAADTSANEDPAHNAAADPQKEGGKA